MKKSIAILFIMFLGIVTGFQQSAAFELLGDCKKVGKPCKGLDDTCHQMVMGCYEELEEPDESCSPNRCGWCETLAPDKCGD